MTTWRMMVARSLLVALSYSSADRLISLKMMCSLQQAQHRDPSQGERCQGVYARCHGSRLWGTSNHSDCQLP